MSIVSTDKDDLPSLFPLPCQYSETRGIGDGCILKFKTFYLKIYDDEPKNGYIIQGYHYNKKGIVFEDRVPINQIKKYASQFNKEDYLRWKIDM